MWKEYLKQNTKVQKYDPLQYFYTSTTKSCWFNILGVQSGFLDYKDISAQYSISPVLPVLHLTVSVQWMNMHTKQYPD